MPSQPAVHALTPLDSPEAPEDLPLPMDPNVSAADIEVPVMGNMEIKTNCLRVDPRNDLPLATVPHDLQSSGDVDWNASVVYWFGVVDRCNSRWGKERRALFVSDDFIYIAHICGPMARAVPIRNIKSVAVSHEQRWVYVLMEGEHDLRFCCLEPCSGQREGKAVPFFLGVLARLWPDAHGGVALPMRRLPADHDPKQVVNLDSPWLVLTRPQLQYPRARAALVDHQLLSRPGTARAPPPPQGPRPITAPANNQQR